MAKKKTQPEKTQFKLPLRKISLIFSIVFLGILISIMSIWFYLKDKFYPFLTVANIEVGALTRDEAKVKILTSLKERVEKPIVFYYQESSESGKKEEYEISLKNQIDSQDIDQALDEAFAFGHTKLPPFTKTPINLDLTFNSEYEKTISAISKQVDKTPISSQLKVLDEQINVTPSQDGLILDQQKLEETLESFVNTNKLADSNLPTKKEPPKLSYEDALGIKKRLDEIKLQPIKLEFDDLEYTLDLDTILSLIDLENTTSSLARIQIFNHSLNIESFENNGSSVSDIKLTLNDQKLDEYLKKLSTAIDRPVIEPLFSFDGTRVSEFQPPQTGRTLNIPLAKAKIAQTLVTQKAEQVTLPVDEVSPKNKLTNDLGIKEMVGQGVSNFAGSIENRIYNVRLGASKINGILINPGEEFSFNKIVGDISAATGFKQAYVIKSGRTVLDDGGGICQVSTTLFRAVLNSGLPITSRTAHAYRVTYYEQGYPPGLDATIFHPSVDFRFKNDTGAHILIQSYVVGTTLYVDFYGTYDGRIVNISTPITTGQTPPPPELRQDDPTLPRGTVKQVDWSAWGAKVSFKRTVKRGGEVLINETFNSNYRPWQAVFLVGTKEG